MRILCIVIPAFAALTFVLSAWLTRRFSRPGSWFHILDVPNVRSLHDSPKPRGGGVAMLLAVYVTLGLAACLLRLEAREILAWVGVAGLLVAAISFIDDRISIPIIYRLIAHVAAAFLILQAGLGLERIEFPGGTWAMSAAMAGGVSLLYIVWMTNLYNFMDGMDGLAAGMAVFGFGAYAVIGAIVGDVPFSMTSAVIAASAGGFLMFNFPPARIFMGDVGSSLLGLSAAALSLWGVQRGVFPFWAALLVFSPFIVDATVTLFRRILCRERFWEAHRSHYYQRLVRSGWSQRQVVVGGYVLMAACGASALWGAGRDPLSQWLVIGGWAVIYGMLMWSVSYRDRFKRRPGSRT